MSEDLTVNDILPAPQREYRYGTIRVVRELMEQLGIDVTGVYTQGEFANKGVFTELHKKLLLPESYTIWGVFLHWPYREWEIVVESPDLPVIDQGSMPPAITPIYEYIHLPPYHPMESYRLKEIKIEDRWQRTYSPGEVTPERLAKG